jgi:hypothetical protein
MANRSLKEMSRALDNRLAPLENKPEYSTEWKPLQEIDDLDEIEGARSENDGFIWGNWDGL